MFGECVEAAEVRLKLVSSGVYCDEEEEPLKGLKVGNDFISFAF